MKPMENGRIDEAVAEDAERAPVFNTGKTFGKWRITKFLGRGGMAEVYEVEDVELGSRYALKPGDVVEWVYTCSLGVDVGGYYAVSG